MKLKALIFDVDGTLADTEEVHRRAFNEAFQVHGLDWNWSKPVYFVVKWGLIVGVIALIVT